MIGSAAAAAAVHVQVDLKQQDVSGIDFIAARTSSRSALSAALRLPHHLRTAIKAELLPAAAGSSSTAAAGVAAAASVAVDASGFFELRGLKPGAYVLKLSCDAAAAGGLSCEPWTMPVQVGPPCWSIWLSEQACSLTLGSHCCPTSSAVLCFTGMTGALAAADVMT